ncbi:hypothetical protein AAFP35_23680 [Gordonia sp. CPCC 206044]|uniref:DUF7832 domain-containing protein n=1 Tax=Gordonia sp. CPCC 206044 TaxID=3140793 RepID=UPI003AF36D6A
MPYDDADWHTDSVTDLGLDRTAAAFHIGVFLAWAAKRGMISPDLDGRAAVMRAVDDRGVSPGRFADDHFVGQFYASTFTARAARFTEECYRAYLGALPLMPVGARYESTYEIPDTWDSYDEIEPYLDELYAVWESEHRNP